MAKQPKLPKLLDSKIYKSGQTRRCTTSKYTTVEALPKDNIFSDVYSYVDPETGVNYLIYSDYQAGGITVRLNADGTPYVTSLDKVSEE